MKRVKKKEETTKHNENDAEINVRKSEPGVRSIKRNDAFEEPFRKSHKKHCHWMKYSSDTYCPNIKFLKTNRVHRRDFDRLRNYVMSEPNISDLSRERETLSR